MGFLGRDTDIMVALLLAFGVMLARSSCGVVGNEIVSQIHIGYTFRH